MNKVRWVFFDMGSTLLDEEEAYRRRARDMVRGTAGSFEQFWEKRIQFAKEGFNGDAKAAEYFGLAKTPWPSEEERRFPDAAQTLQALSDRGYRLGVVANQSPGAAARLDGWGLGRYFSVVAASAELGIAKPDKRIFLYALESAGCAPENAVMVGDRLDNDIRPAKELGMRTVRIRKGLAVYMSPRCDAENPDHTINELHELLEVL